MWLLNSAFGQTLVRGPIANSALAVRIDAGALCHVAHGVAIDRTVGDRKDEAPHT